MKTTSQHAQSLLTKQEVAQNLKVCLRTVENLMAAKRIEYLRIGRAVRITPEALARFKQSLTIEAIQ